jgi:hypothetical protein
VHLTQTRPLSSVQVNNAHGSINVGLTGGQGFTLSATTRHGDLENDFELPEMTSGEQKTLTGSVAGGGPTVTLTTTDGDVTIRKTTVDPLPGPLPMPNPHVTPVPPESTNGPKPPPAPKSVKPSPEPPAQPKIPNSETF